MTTKRAGGKGAAPKAKGVAASGTLPSSSLSPDEYRRAVRLYDATPADCPDEKRLEHVLGVLRMLANRVRPR